VTGENLDEKAVSGRGSAAGDIGPAREKICLTVNRCLAFFGALAFAAAQPAVTLGAPPAGQVHARAAAPAPHAAGGAAHATNQGDFKVPFEVDLRPKPLAETQHFTIQSSAGSIWRAALSPYQWYKQSSLGNLMYPALYGLGCQTSNNFLGSPSAQQPSNLTIGSLVDGKSKLLSSSAPDAGLAMGKDPGAASSSPFTLQAGFYPTACGASTFTNF
jgi:hypothetical protein